MPHPLAFEVFCTNATNPTRSSQLPAAWRLSSGAQERTAHHDERHRSNSAGQGRLSSGHNLKERSGTGLAHHGYGNAVYGCPAGGGVRFHPQAPAGFHQKLTRSGSLVRGQLRAAFREADETHEWRSSSKDYADAEDDAVNQRTPKSVEGKELAPQVGFEPTTLRLTAEPLASVRSF